MPYPKTVHIYYENRWPAIGLIVEKWAGGAPCDYGVVDTKGHSGIQWWYPGNRVKVRRGLMYFDVEWIVPDNSYDYMECIILDYQWPPQLTKLKEALNTRDPESGILQRELIKNVAVRVLEALRDSGDIERVTNPDRFGEGSFTDNPHIMVGALICALSISFLYPTTPEGPYDYNSYETLRSEFWAIKSGLWGLTRFIHTLQHPDRPGYYLRWKQAQPDSRLDPSDCHAEPSLDEYSGLILGLKWGKMLSIDPRGGCDAPDNPPLGYLWYGRIRARYRELLADINNYLYWSEGWLIRPVQKDLTLRGPDLVANAFPLRLIFQDEGHQRGQESFVSSTPLDISDKVDNFLSNSEVSLEELRQGGDNTNWAYEKYKETLAPLFAARDAEDDIHLLEWAGGIVAAVGAATSFYGGAILLLIGIGISSLAYVADKAIDELSDYELWDLFGQALGPPASVDAGGYNVTIFDRLSLAATWSGNLPLEEVFNKRAARDPGGDRQGWKSLGMACRVWLGSDFDGQNLFSNLLADARSLEAHPPANLENIEGFVLGWCLLCLALGMEPGIAWRDIIQQRFATCSPDEIRKPDYPRYEVYVHSATLNETMEPAEEPFLWIIPIVANIIDDKLHYNILPSSTISLWVPGQPSHKTGDVIKPLQNKIKWSTEFLTRETIFLIVTIGWEYDFTGTTYLENNNINRRYPMDQTIKIIQDALNERLDHPGAFGTWLCNRLKRQLCYFYPKPFASSGSRFSDDDYVGVEVKAITIPEGSSEVITPFEITLERDPKPRPKFTSLTVRGEIRYIGHAPNEFINDDYWGDIILG